MGPLPKIPRVKPETLAHSVPSSAANSSQAGTANQASASTDSKSKSAVIDLTLSDDDEPTVLNVKKTEPEIELDAERSKTVDTQIVCMGMIRSNMTAVGHLPVHMVSNQASGRTWYDELYSSEQWPSLNGLPRGSAFWTEPGYRPVHIECRPHTVKQVPTGRFINDRWETREELVPTPHALVRCVLSPAHVVQNERMRNQAAGNTVQLQPTGPLIIESIGQLYERTAVLLSQIIANGGCALESRFKVIPKFRATSPFQQVEINVFAPRWRIAQIISAFRQNNLYFERPSAYDPTDYPGAPPLVTEHLLSYGGAGPSIHQIGLGTGSSVSYAPVDTQEEARKQVDQVYSTLRAGEDLPVTEPGRLLKTRLFPHQKQALSFLLDREKERSWEVESSDSESGQDSDGSSKGKKKSNGKAGGSGRKSRVILSDSDADMDAEDKKAAGSSKDGKAKDDEGADASKKKEKAKKKARVVSLWKAEKNPYTDEVTSYTNVVTNQKQKHRPQICRGAILADDMGLGKTISIIALMTRTWKAANEFGRSKVTKVEDVDLPEDDDDDDADGAADANSFSFGGIPRARPPSKKRGKKEKKWREQERARISNLQRRSRATLIVCPLTVVPNWIDQINEHWENRQKPKIYTYHGPNRQQSIPFLANHDVIITTYSTLAYEFGRSSAWADEDEVDGDIGSLLTAASATSKGAKSAAAGSSSKGANAYADSDSDDDEEFEMYDAKGRKISRNSAGKSKAGAKRKKGGKKEAFNPLQRIEFFRVVLDESHMIKETSTLQSKAVCNLSAQRRLSLTGTPIQNKLDDLYSQFKFLRLDPFHKKNVWTKFCMHSSRISLKSRKEAQAVDSIGLARIQTMMKAVALRRTKETKDKDGEPILKLPPKASRIVTLEFDEHERAKYEAMRHRYKEDFEEMVKSDSVGKNYASILVEINALRLTCDDATLVDFGKDMKRAKAGRADLIAAIREDGLSSQRAVQLFKVFVDCDQGACYDCERDLSHKLDGDDEEDDEDAPKKRNAKKAKTTGKGGRAGAGAGAADDEQTDANPVVTRCQHLFCTDCFASKLGDAWERPKSDTKAPCPQCNESLTVTLDAIEIDQDLLQESADRYGGRGGRGDYSDSEEDDFDTETEDESDAGDGSDTDPDDEEEEEGARTWRPRSKRRATKLIIDDDDEDEDEEEDEDEDDKKGKRNTRNGGAKDEEEEDSLGKVQAALDQERKKDSMSSKVRALVAELEPFSRCNPASALYDEKAPRLDHWAPPPPKKEEPAANETNGIPATLDVKKTENEGLGMPSGSGSADAGPSVKAEAPAFEPVQVISLPSLDALTDEEAAEARKAEPIKSVVFSQWTRMLDRIGKALEKKGIRYARLDGSMTRIARTKALDQFKNNRKIEVLLISLRAGGFGLNLVSACRAYLIDPYWNPAVENQGLDRIYRLGQRRPVVLTRFIMKKSIEENMLELQKRKMELAEQVGQRRGPQSAQERREERERDLRDLLR